MSQSREEEGGHISGRGRGGVIRVVMESAEARLCRCSDLAAEDKRGPGKGEEGRRRRDRYSTANRAAEAILSGRKSKRESPPVW